MRSVHHVAHLTLDVIIDPRTDAPAFVYDGVVGNPPTIVVSRGDLLIIDLSNRMAHANFTANDVNLHFHGLQISPTVASDDVLMTVAHPGQTLRYHVRIPVDQQPGMYWYHSHSHGEAYWQTTSGLSGALIVRGLREEIPALRGLRERVLVARDAQVQPNILSIPWYARKRVVAIEMQHIPHRGNLSHPIDPDDADGPNSPCAAEPNMQVTVNGQIDPGIPIKAGEHEFFRFLNASASRIFDLSIPGERFSVVAMDGYPVGSAVGNPPYISMGHIVVPPGGRSEFIAVGPRATAQLVSRCYNSGPAGDRDPQVNIATLVVSGRAPSGRVTVGRTTIARIPPIETLVKTREIRLSEDTNGFYIDGQAFRMGVPPLITARAGTVEHWRIVNTTDEVHAFHLHQVHFLVQSINGETQNPQLWMDTVIVPARSQRTHAPGAVDILVDFRNPIVRGTFVFHCHMADHEDGGMMAIIRVI